jgi:uncharacterized membrane protein AbrB (regulator of aidB expression)
VKTALALVLAFIAPVHLRFAVLGVPVSVPVAWLLIAAEALAVAGTAYLTFRAARRFRSAPWPRLAFAGGRS